MICQSARDKLARREAVFGIGSSHATGTASIERCAYKAVLYDAMLASGCAPVPVRGLLYVVQTAFGRVVECGRVKCA